MYKYNVYSTLNQKFNGCLFNNDSIVLEFFSVFTCSPDSLCFRCFFFPPSHPTPGMRFTLGVPMTQVSALLKRMPSMQQRHHATTSFCRCSVDWGDMVIYSKMWCSIGDEVKKNETCYNWKRLFRHLKPFLQNEGCVRGNRFTAFLLYHEGKTSCHNDLECMLAHLKSNQIHLSGYYLVGSVLSTKTLRNRRSNLAIDGNTWNLPGIARPVAANNMILGVW